MDTSLRWVYSMWVKVFVRKELHLQHLTVKNVVNMSFKNPTSNEKVRLVKEEMNLPE